MKLHSIVATAVGFLAVHATAFGALLVVDDDGIPCPGARYQTIEAAIQDAQPGDEVHVCGGTYPEQVVITKDLRLTGQRGVTGSTRIQPTALTSTQVSGLGPKAIAAGILVDNVKVLIDTIEVDLSAAGVTGCSPVLVGVYLRNSRGVVSDSRIEGVNVVGQPACDSGVALYIESSPVSSRFGETVFGKAKVTVRDNELVDFQKGGLVVNGAGANVKMSGGEVTGTGLLTGAVQNGVQFGLGARGKIQAVTINKQLGGITGKTAAGILAYQAAKLLVRKTTIADSETGIFVLGDKVRILGSEVSNLADDGVVLLGDSTLVSGTTVDGAGVTGVYVDGDRNTVRWGMLANVPVGLWFYDGVSNSYSGVDFFNVPLRFRGEASPVRTVDDSTAAPFLTACRSAADCDDGFSCTVDVCDLQAGTCSNVSSCDDANPCTDDACTAGGCTNTHNTAPCNDGNACTVGDTCHTGTCGAGLPIVCDDNSTCTFDACSPLIGCVHLSACDDHNPCTADACSQVTGCSNTLQPDGSPCPDPNPCNGAETCTAGVCTAGVPPNCDDSNPCTADSCTIAGGCQHAGVTNNTTCFDGDVCNGAETCQAGVCASGAPLNCNDGNPCTADSCNAISGCVHSPIGGCTNCTTPANCDDANPCTVDACNGGACQNTAASNGTPCPDADVCNGAETCQAGACTPSAPLACDDGNVCTDDSCDPVAGCPHPPVADGTSCADGTVCNGAEICTGGVCTPGTALSCDDGNPCTSDTCLPVSGCSATAVADGTACADATVCNGAETCQSGVCTAGTAPNCDDSNVCTVDSCDPVNGCQNPAEPNGTPCVDGDVCNGDEVCTGGSCGSPGPLNCNDGNACTVDTCNALSGCINTPIPGCQPCAVDANCDDGAPCTADVCNAGVCQNPALADGSPCPDGDACNGDETCVGGMCTAGTGLTCDDSSDCTLDSCDPGTGCVFTPVTDSTPCPDGTVCNGDETCQAGVCTPGTPLNCNDGNACTLDVCNAVSGCQYSPRPDGTSCADTTVCNGDETCTAGLCMPGTPLDCDDLNPCTADSCSPLAGCVNVPIVPCP